MDKVKVSLVKTNDPDEGVRRAKQTVDKEWRAKEGCDEIIGMEKRELVCQPI